MINILIALAFDSPAPFALVHKEVAKRLDPDEFNVLTFFNSQIAISELPSHVTPIILPRWESSIKPLATVGKAIQILPKFLSAPLNILHTVADPRLLLLRWIHKVSNIKGKHIITIHGLPWTAISCYVAGKLLSRDADAVTSVSKYTAQIVKRFYNLDSIVIYNGVDTEFFRGVEHYNERLRILYVGRLVEWKRPHWVAKLAKFFPRCDFVLHGRGPMRQVLEQMTTNLPNMKVDSSFIDRQELRDLYAKSDIFLFPSTDWLPLVTLEAMASHLPVLLHSIGGQAELIENGKQGLLASTFEEMKENLNYLIEDENIRNQFGKNARIRSLDFDWNIIAKHYSNLYKNLV